LAKQECLTGRVLREHEDSLLVMRRAQRAKICILLALEFLQSGQDLLGDLAQKRVFP
jgi:hypothetical protein